ncbi:unnamed protein product, partial [Meganyctiphanes norvegica]
MTSELSNEHKSNSLALLEAEIWKLQNSQKRPKYGEQGDLKSFVLQLSWSTDYPDVTPQFNLDVFYNKHILPCVKEKILSGLKEQAEANLGMSMTYTIFEWVKEVHEELLEEQIADASMNTVAEVSSGVDRLNVDCDKEDCQENKSKCITLLGRRYLYDADESAVDL